MTLRRKRDLALEEAAVAFARKKYADPSDDDIVIYDSPDVSLAGDDGFWVRAVVYVRREEAKSERQVKHG